MTAPTMTIMYTAIITTVMIPAKRQKDFCRTMGSTSPSSSRVWRKVEMLAP
jgi:hypothetical protein